MMKLTLARKLSSLTSSTSHEELNGSAVVGLSPNLFSGDTGLDSLDAGRL